MCRTANPKHIKENTRSKYSFYFPLGHIFIILLTTCHATKWTNSIFNRIEVIQYYSQITTPFNRPAAKHLHLHSIFLRLKFVYYLTIRLFLQCRRLRASIFGQFNFGLVITGAIVAIIFGHFVCSIGSGSRTQWLTLWQYDFGAKAGHIGIDAGRCGRCGRCRRC